MLDEGTGLSKKTLDLVRWGDSQRAQRPTTGAENWKVSGRGGAAELLDLKPTTLSSRMKRLGITREDPDQRGE